METNSTPKFWIITILSLLFVGVMMIPITGLVIAPNPIANQIDTPLFELANYSLNDVWGTPESYDVDTFILNDIDTPITELNNHTLREVFEGDNIVQNGYFYDSNNLWTGVGNTININTTFKELEAYGDGTLNYFLLTYDTNVPNYSGQKFYVKYRTYVNGGNPTSIQFVSSTNLGGSDTIQDNIVSPNQFIWYERSLIITNTANTNNFRLYFNVLFPNNTEQDNTLMHINYVYLFDISTLTTFNNMSDVEIESQMDYWFSVYQSIINSQPINNDYPNIIYNNYYVSDLITNKEWSPLYQTTFDLLTNAQIISQMDRWIMYPWQFLNYNSFSNWKPSQAQIEYYHELYLYYKDFE